MTAPAHGDSRRSRALLVILAVQALWLGIVMLRGWYSGPDLGNLSAATGQPLDWHYLSQSLGGHPGPPGRLIFWLLNRIAPLNWGLTVVVRLLLQAAATYLLWALLHDLVGARRWLPAVVGLYAISPILVPATAVLTNVIGLAIAQVAVLGALLLHVRYTRSGGLGTAMAVAGLAGVALLFAAQSALGVALLPLLSLGFLHTGSVRERLSQARGRWLGWVALGVVLAGVAAFFASAGSAGGPARTFTLPDAWTVAQDEWLHVLGPAFVGGPWDWSTHPEEWVSYADPPVVAVVLGQVVLVLAVLASVRRTGRRALLGWAVPVLVSIGGALLVGYGRSDYLGTYIAPIMRYSYFTALALALGVTLAFARTPEEGDVEVPVRSVWPVNVGAALLAVASLVSGIGFANRFWENPSRDYVQTLVASSRAAGPTVELYDAILPGAVVPALEPDHFVSDVLGLAGVQATFGGSSPTPLMVSDQGHLVPSGFVPAADVVGPTTTECGTFVSGAGSTTVDLGTLPSINDWFLQLQIYQPRPNTFTLSARDADGNAVPIASGSARVATAGTLVAVNRRFAPGQPTSLTIVTTEVQSNFCLVHAFVGAPFVKRD